MNHIHFSHLRPDWRSPRWIFDFYDRQFHFDLDAAADDFNHLCSNYFTVTSDALKQDWTQYNFVWCNPPYGRDLIKWVHKAFITGRSGGHVIMLLPARTDTKWFHLYCDDVTFIHGRLKFDDSNSPAPFPSMIVRFG